VARYPPPGRLIDAGGFRLHLNTAGARRPLVVFDAALGASSLSWVFVQPPVADFARTCIYDRAGFAWSERGPLPRTVGRAAEELRVALDRAGETPPFLLVGHSYGGLVMRTFAGRYRSEVAGLVLVDPAHPEDWIDPAPKEQIRIDRGVYLCRQARLASRTGLAHVVSGLVKAGAIPVAKRIVNMVSRSRLDADIDWMLAPFLALPDEVRHQVRRFWTQPKFFEALGSQIGSMPQSARETLAAAPEGYGDLPLVTITKADPDTHRWRRQEAVAQLSTRGRHVVASRAGHWIPLEEPEIIVNVIAEMHAAVIGGPSAPG
jgi:pimeloyl-ACP methyl ester carboxylesterase